jgi:hypothetical protein
MDWRPFERANWGNRPQYTSGPLTPGHSNNQDRHPQETSNCRRGSRSRRDALRLVLAAGLLPLGAARAQLFHRDRKPAQVGVRHWPDLPARELQNGALLIGEHNRADATIGQRLELRLRQ